MSHYKKQFYDKHGIPIQANDLLKTYHFTGTRKKRYFMYHLVVEHEGCLRMLNAHAIIKNGQVNWMGGCLLGSAVAGDGCILRDSEIVEGFHPDFEERERLHLPVETLATVG